MYVLLQNVFITIFHIFQIARLAYKGFASGLAGLLSPAPVVEGPNDARFLPSFMGEQPGSVLDRGAFPKIPMLIGVTKDETYPAVHGTVR